MTNWDRYRLPPHATRIDHVTLRIWKEWHATMRPALGLAFQIAATLATALLAALLLADAISSGAWATAAAGVIIAGIVATALSRKSRRPALQHPARSRTAAMLVALSLAMVLLFVGAIAAGLLTAFVVIPVSNYGLPAFLILIAGAVAIGAVLVRSRNRETNRYPHRSPRPER